jgi:hypothetical protein
MAADGTSADTANVARPTVASLNDTEMTGSDTRTAPAGDAHADVRYSRHTDLDGPDDNV